MVYDALTPAQREAVDKNSGLAFSLKGAKLYEMARKGGLKTVTKRADTKITKLTAAEMTAWKDRLRIITDKWVDDFEKKGLPYRKLVADYLAK